MPVKRSLRVVAMMAPLFVAVSCSASDDGIGSTTAPVSSTPVSADVSFGGPQRLGDGTTVAAHYSPPSDRLVAVTTVGLAVSDGWSTLPEVTERPAGDVGRTAMSPDGTRLALTAASPPRLEVWNLEEAILEFEVQLASESDIVHTLVYDESGANLFVGTNRSVARLSAAGDLVTLIEVPPGEELGPARVAGNGGRIVALRSNGLSASLMDWTEATGASAVPIEVAEGLQADSLELTQGSERAVVAVRSAVDPAADSLMVFDLATGERIGEPIGRGTLSGSFWALGPSDGLVVAGSTALTIYDLAGSTVSRADLTGQPAIVSLSPPTRGDAFVTVHEDGSLVVWNSNAERTALLASTVGAVREVTRPDDMTVVTVGQSGRIDRWDLGNGLSSGVIDRYAGGSVNSVDISPDGGQIAVAHSTGVVSVLDSSSGASVMGLDHDGRNVDTVAFSPDGTALATGVGERITLEAFDDTVRMWDLANAAVVAERGGEGENVAGCSYFENLVRFSPDGSLLAAASHDFTVHLFSTEGLVPVLELPPHGSTVLDIAFSGDGRWIVTSSEDWTVRIWDVANGDLISDFETRPGGYRRMAFSPDGLTLATIGATGAVEFVSVADGRVERTLSETVSWTSNIVFSPDGSRMYAGGRNGDVIVWTTVDGVVVDRLEGHAGAVNSVDVSMDGALLVSGSEDGTARRWEIGA